MTTRRYGYIVILDDDVREDSDEAIVNALRMVKRVIAVEPLETEASDVMARERARHDLGMKIVDAVHNIVFP